MGVVGHDGGGDDDGAVEGVGRSPLERDRSQRGPGVTVSDRSLVDTTAGHVFADGGQAGVVSAEGNVPTTHSLGVSVGCNVKN